MNRLIPGFPTAIWVAAALFATGCQSVGPDYQEPTADLPEQWSEATGTTALPAADAADWWRHFADPQLDRLIAHALEQGPDGREALARLREARALRGVAAAERVPVVDAGASYQRQRASEASPAGAATGEFDLYSAGLDASWELDLWGRVDRLVEAADAEVAALEADLREVTLLVAAEVAFNYVELRGHERRAAIAATNIDLQEQTLQLVQSRFEAGLVGERDLAQAAANLATTRARLPALDAAARAAGNRLAVLLGVTPMRLRELVPPAPTIPVAPVEIATGVPAEVLRRRPDVRRAERLLAAEHARIGVATAELYPRLALFGSLGVAAEDLSDLTRDGSHAFSIGPSIRWSLFNGGKLRRRIEAQDARAEQALIRWERTVLQALEETENGLTSFLREQQRRQWLLAAAEQARRAVDLAQFQYAEGQSDFQVVLDSQRALAVVEDDLAQAEAAISTHAVALFKALGG